jgi:hypothetical protein
LKDPIDTFRNTDEEYFDFDGENVRNSVPMPITTSIPTEPSLNLNYNPKFASELKYFTASNGNMFLSSKTSQNKEKNIKNAKTLPDTLAGDIVNKILKKKI